MEDNCKAFMWSDNWWIEDDRAWFVAGAENILFSVNLMTNQCESATKIPDQSSSKFRLTPYCMKNGNDIFCMPDCGSSIWVYHLNTKSFTDIYINNPNNIRLSVCDFWLHENKIYAVSNGLKQVIEINAVENRIENYYTLCNDGSITKSIKGRESIYSVSGESCEIYEFNLITKTVTIHNLPDIKHKIFTVCFDGNKFWLSGYKKELYVWDKKENTIEILDKFPKSFGSYNFTKDTDGKVDCETDEYELPAFLYSVNVNGSVWFIPFQTNQILYWDRENKDIAALEVDEEIETKESLLGRFSLSSKYIVEYIRYDRYLGLFSIKNNCILEIDTLEKKAKMKHYTLDNKCMNEMMHIYEQKIFLESDSFHKDFFIHMFEQNIGKKEKKTINIGTKIYRTLGDSFVSY